MGLVGSFRLDKKEMMRDQRRRYKKRKMREYYDELKKTYRLQGKRFLSPSQQKAGAHFVDGGIRWL